MMLARAHTQQATVAAFVSIGDDCALAAARRADEELLSGLDRGPLHGIPLAVKDNLTTVDFPTTANSLVLDRRRGAMRDATAVARLRAAGAVIVGKNTLFEFATGWPDPRTGFPITRNPWGGAHTPGGSSSGTAAAVAASMVCGGVGTDTGGSIRVPASFCGVTGMKPTFHSPIVWTTSDRSPGAPTTVRSCLL
jgi:aspartyl-tRNA(Asn)/glutamyl-tRNA(Gln) amidotransferase subunit A